MNKIYQVLLLSISISFTAHSQESLFKGQEFVTYKNISQVKQLQHQNEQEKALEAYLKAIEEAKKNHQLHHLKSLYLSVGELYYHWQSYTKALGYFKKYNASNTLYTGQDIKCILFIAKTYKHLGKLDDALKNCIKGIEKAKKINSKKLELELSREVSNLLFRQKDYQQALTYYQKVLKLEEKYGSKNSMTVSLNNIGVLYAYLKQPKYAVDYLEKAYLLDETQADKLKKSVDILLNTISVYYATGLGNTSFEEALQILEQKYGQSEMGEAFIYLAAFEFRKENYTPAMTYSKRAYKLGEVSGSSGVLKESFNLMSKIYEVENKHKKALHYYKLFSELQFKEHLQTEDDKQKLYAQQLEVEEKENQIQLLIAENEVKSLEMQNCEIETDKIETDLQLMQKNHDLQVSNIRAEQLQKEALQKELLLAQRNHENTLQKQAILNLEKDKKIKELQLKKSDLNQKKIELEANQQRKEIMLLRKEQQLKKMQRNLLALALSLLILFFILIGLRIRKNQQIQKMTQRAIKAELENEQLQKVRLAAELENKKLKEQQMKYELDIKSKELTGYTLNMIQKNEVLLELKEHLKEILILKGTEQRRKVNQLKNYIHYSFTVDKDWDNFKKMFENINQDFFSKLKEKFPRLTSRDLRFCALSKLHINSKEIASILGVSVDSIKTFRYRIRKKIQLEPETDFITFLNQVA